MADLTFAREYRPNSLKGYIGNEKVKDTISNILSKNGKLPQTILLEGNTGCGKTTMARILIKEYACENRTEDGHACGVCDSCKEMDEYIKSGASDMLQDVREVDIADQSGKKDIDEVLEDVYYPALGGGWKYYLFDECHKASEGAQTRMLKIVEEPPENVLMIFCTTDSHRMLPTLLNRCQLKLHVDKPKLEDLIKLMSGICKKEDIEYDQEGLRIIANRAGFVVRDSLNFLDQVALSRGKATSDAVKEEFNEVTDDLMFSFMEAYIDKDYMGYISVLFDVKTTVGFKLFLSSLITFISRGIYIINGIRVSGMSKYEIEKYADLFSQFTEKDISLLLKKVKGVNKDNDEALEIDLIAMLYMDDREEIGEVKVVKQGIKDENKERIKNLEKKEQKKKNEGSKVLEDETQEITDEELDNLFGNIEVVE